MKEVLVAFGFGDKIEKGEKGEKIVNAFINIQPINGVIPTGKVDTSKLKIIDRPIEISDRLKKVEFSPKKTSLNIYETDHHLIIVRSKLNEIWTTPFKDKNGVPVYSLKSISAVDSPPKATLAQFKEEKKS